MGATSPSVVEPAETRAYISDILSQLADLARGLGDRRLETSIRLLALEAEIGPKRGARYSSATRPS